MKRILGLSVAITILMMNMPSLNVSAGGWGNWEDYEYWVGNGSVKITEYTGAAKSLLIPDTIDGYVVTSIGEYAFRNCMDLMSIIIPESVTSIGEAAFDGCTGLKSITIPNRVTFIGNAVFRNCTSLTSMDIPSSVTAIGTPLKEDVYYRYRNNLFAGCTNLTKITVDLNNANFASDEQGILYNKDKTKLIECPPGKVGIVEIPNGVTEIGREAFRNGAGLTSITIPNSTKSIGRSAFEHCTSLTEITIPDGVTIINSYSFYACTNLTSISLPNSITTIELCAFDTCTSLISINIPDGVASIGTAAFSGCTSLTSIDIPNSVKSFDGSVFKDCTNLISITMPDSMTGIGGMCVFENCSSLKSITLPEGIDEVGYCWFDGCSSLESVVIPDNVKCFCQDAFKDCTSLKSIDIPNSVTKIVSGAFAGCSSLTAVNMPDSVEYIGLHAFEGCSNLKTLHLSNNVDRILDYTFTGCTSLTSVNIPGSVARVGYEAFFGCINLETVIFNNPNTIIEETEYISPAIPGPGANDPPVSEKVFRPTFDGCDSLKTIYGYYSSTAEAFSNNQGKNFIPIVKVQLNEVDLDFDVPPQLINDRTMVPMCKIFDALGADVYWNSENQTITAKKDDFVIIMQIDNVVISVNGIELTLDVPPVLTGERILVPVRAVAEGLNADVNWDGETQTVIITKEDIPVSD